MSATSQVFAPRAFQPADFAPTTLRGSGSTEDEAALSSSRIFAPRVFRPRAFAPDTLRGTETVETATCRPRPSRATAHTISLSMVHTPTGSSPGDAVSLPFITESFGSTPLVEDGRYDVTGLAANAGLVVSKDAGGDVTAELQPLGPWPILLLHALGGSVQVTDLGDGLYRHDLAGSNTRPGILSIEKRIGFNNSDDVEYLHYPNCAVEELQIHAPRERFVRTRATIVATREDDQQVHQTIVTRTRPWVALSASSEPPGDASWANPMLSVDGNLATYSECKLNGSSARVHDIAVAEPAILQYDVPLHESPLAMHDQPFNAFNGSITLDIEGNGSFVSVGTFSSFTITIRNRIAESRPTSAAPWRDRLPILTREITGSGQVFFTPEAMQLYERFHANATLGVSLTLSSPAAIWQITLPAIQLRGNLLGKVARPGPVEMPLQFTAHRSQSADTDLNASIRVESPVLAGL